MHNGFIGYRFICCKQGSHGHPALYWIVILATSTAGTTMPDYMDRTLELGYATGSAVLVTGLTIILIACIGYTSYRHAQDKASIA